MRSLGGPTTAANNRHHDARIICKGEVETRFSQHRVLAQARTHLMLKQQKQRVRACVVPERSAFIRAASGAPEFSASSRVDLGAENQNNFVRVRATKTRCAHGEAITS